MFFRYKSKKSNLNNQENTKEDESKYYNKSKEYFFKFYNGS